MRSADAWLVYGSRHARDVIDLGADPARTVIAPITAIAPDPPLKRFGTNVLGVTRYLFVGRLIERKGLDVLLEAFRHLDLGELWIAGDGPLGTTVEAAAAANPRIRFFGYAEGEALADIYRQADVLMVPSLYEPWGLVVHEGLAWGLPVIVTDEVGAGDDLVDPGTNGYVVPPASSEALAEAMKAVARWTDEQWKEAGRRSNETLAACSIDRAVEGFIQGCSLGLQHRREVRALPSQ